jgi:hypothetical protein
MAKRTEVLANVAFIVLCIILIVKALTGPAETPAAAAVRAAAPAPRPMYQPGETIAVPGVDFAKADRTLLLVIRSTCKYCTESMPFYKDLAGDRRPAGNVRIVALSPDEIPISHAYLGTYSVKLDEVVKVPLTALKVRGTPTAILVDKVGTVLNLWPGMLDAARQQEVLVALNAS